MDEVMRFLIRLRDNGLGLFPWASSIKNDALRIAVLILIEPLSMLHMIVVWSLPVAWGGHPDGRRIFAPDAWAFHFECWRTAVMGYFVDES